MAHIDETGHLIYDQITSNIVVQANYLAGKDDSRVDDGINIYTGLMIWNWGTPPCSHTEIGFMVDGELWFFSSTSRAELGSTGQNGTRWRKGSELLHNFDRWKLQEKTASKIAIFPERFNTNVEAEHRISWKIQRANNIIGLRYDFQGVFTDFIIPWAIFKGRYPTPEELEKLTKIYCSKAVHYVDTGKLAVFSPKRQFTWADKNGYVTVPDTETYLLERRQIA